MAVAPPSLLYLLVLLVGLAAVAAGECPQRRTCRVVCRYAKSYLTVKCKECYPGICEEVSSSLPQTNNKLAALSLAPRNAPHTGGRGVLVVTPAPPPDYTPAPPPGFTPAPPPGFTPAPPPDYTPAPPDVTPQGCYDQNGLLRPPFSTWYDDPTYPCVVFSCPAQGGAYAEENLDVGCPPEPTDFGDCTASRNPGQCCYNYTCHSGSSSNLANCIDSTGTLRAHGQTWRDDDDFPCVTYVCSDGTVSVIQDMRPLCPKIPAAHCVPYRALGQCCNSFNCTITSGFHTCVDSSGSPRPHAAVWYDDVTYPCVKFICNNGTTVTTLDKRDTCAAPPTQAGCQATRASGECCFTYTCGCVYNGEVKQNGEQFVDNAQHPCAQLRCVSGVVVTVTHTNCQPLACTNQVWPLGQCCKQCASCHFGGVEYPVGATWFDDASRPCLQYRCDNGQAVMIQNVTATCMPAPNAYCTPWLMAEVCCTKWDCEEQPCVHNGEKHDHGTTWPEDSVKPCKHLVCNNSRVEVFSEESPCAGPPYPHCTQRDVPYQCCPDWDCVTIQCRYGSDPVQLYSEGQTWYDDPSFPCKRFTCTKTGVVKTQDLISQCQALDPPDCATERRLGECCKRCVREAPHCYDRSGGVHEPNESYFEDPETQCVFVRCLQNTTVTKYDRRDNCPRDPRLTNPRCSEVATENCCPVYQCPDCEYNGRVYPPGAKWWDNDARQCTRYLCAYDGTSTTVFTRLPCPVVRDGCVPNYRGYECCHYKYTCMFDPQNNLIPMPAPAPVG